MRKMGDGFMSDWTDNFDTINTYDGLSRSSTVQDDTRKVNTRSAVISELYFTPLILLS